MEGKLRILSCERASARVVHASARRDVFKGSLVQQDDAPGNGCAYSQIRYGKQMEGQLITT